MDTAAKEMPLATKTDKAKVDDRKPRYVPELDAALRELDLAQNQDSTHWCQIDASKGENTTLGLHAQPVNVIVPGSVYGFSDCIGVARKAPVMPPSFDRDYQV